MVSVITWMGCHCVNPQKYGPHSNGNAVTTYGNALLWHVCNHDCYRSKICVNDIFRQYGRNLSVLPAPLQCIGNLINHHAPQRKINIGWGQSGDNEYLIERDNYYQWSLREWIHFATAAEHGRQQSHISRAIFCSLNIRCRWEFSAIINS